MILKQNNSRAPEALAIHGGTLLIILLMLDVGLALSLILSCGVLLSSKVGNIS